MAALSWLMNLGFAASPADAVVEAATTKGGVGDFRTDHLKRLRLQQIRRDDDEIIAIIAAMIKRG